MKRRNGSVGGKADVLPNFACPLMQYFVKQKEKKVTGMQEISSHFFVLFFTKTRLQNAGKIHDLDQLYDQY